MVAHTIGKLAEYLQNHPRLLGAIFALVVLLGQVQPVLAECSGDGCTGP